MATVAGSTVDAWIHGGRMDPQWQQLPLAATVGRSIGGEAQIQAQLGYGLFRFFVFYSIYRGGHQTASKKVSLTVTFHPRRFSCLPRKSFLPATVKFICSSVFYENVMHIK